MSRRRNSSGGGCLFFFLIMAFFLFVFFVNRESIPDFFPDKSLRVLSSNDNKDLEPSIRSFAKKEGFKVSFTYMGDLDIVDELNLNSDNYDAVWISNSLWLYMLNNSKLTSESKSISISPVVMGVKKSKAEKLGLIDKELTNKDLLDLINKKEIKYVMSSVTQTNDGASAYLGFLNSLAGSPEVLTEKMLDSEQLVYDMKNLFKGVERVSGDQDFLETMFVNGDNYEAVIASESSLIHINKLLKEKNKEELYFLYPTDGVPINDSTLAFIDHYDDTKKKENYLQLQKYLRSKNGQDVLRKMGRRTWYGGVNKSSDKEVFNKSWGIDTSKYLTGTRFPSRKVITKAINLYIEELRKPSHTVFCLDYSGSMVGEGEEELVNAMNYILDYEQASTGKLQFSKYDKITVIPFDSDVREKITLDNGRDTESMLQKIEELRPSGGTALYSCAIEGLKILNSESDDYTKTIIAMTDGEINIGTIYDLKIHYNRTDRDIPIYGILFGKAKQNQLEEIADLTNAKVFNGKDDLLLAFKEVRGYN